MASVLAIVSKAVFEKIVKVKGSGKLGDVLGFDRYTSKHGSLNALEEGGAIFLVTVRPPDEALWLVGILENPTQQDDGWHAAPSTEPIRDVSSVKSQLQFATGAGLTAKKGALGMSLQTPRVLADSDADLLRNGGSAKKPSGKTTAKPAKAAPTKPAAKSTKSGKSKKKTTAAKKTSKSSSDDDDEEATGDSARALDAIAVAIDDGDGAAALEAALAAWRTARVPALADLIDAISGQISEQPVDGELEFTAVAKSRDATDLGRLLAAVPSLPVSFLPPAAEMLVELPDDPRLAKAVATWALDPLATSSSAYPFWVKSLAAVQRIGDTRVVPLIAKRLRMPQEMAKAWRNKNKKPSQFWGKFYTALEKLKVKLEALPVAALDTKAIARAAKLAKRVGSLAVVEGSAAPAPKSKANVPKLDGPPLAQALAHVTADRVGPAIDALLVYWRDQRAPVVADLIDRATRLLPSYDRPFPVEPKPANAAWTAAFADDPMAAMPQLLHHINAGGSAAAERHLLDLASLPDDPRIALRLAEISRLFGVGPERTQYWKTFWEILARIRDIRTTRPLRTAFNDFTGTYYNHHRQGRRIVGPWVLNPGEPPALDHAAYKPLEQIGTALGKLEAKRDRTEQGFIDAIAADWNDEGPRLVYADWLTEREHPRGEAIVLACKQALSPAETKRLRQLVHGTRDSPPRVYGPLTDMLQRFIGPDVIDRGIPSRLIVRPDTSGITFRHLDGEPLLACVEAIEFDPKNEGYGDWGHGGEPEPEHLARVLLDPIAKRLTTVGGQIPGDLLVAVEPLVARRWKRKGHMLVRV